MTVRRQAARESAERRKCPDCSRKGALRTWSGTAFIECRYCGYEIDRRKWEAENGPMIATDEREMRRLDRLERLEHGEE